MLVRPPMDCRDHGEDDIRVREWIASSLSSGSSAILLARASTISIPATRLLRHTIRGEHGDDQRHHRSIERTGRGLALHYARRMDRSRGSAA